MDVKVLVALPTAEFSRRADFYDFYNQLIKPEGTLLCCAHGQSPSRNRNIMIRQALEAKATHIFFVDDDMCLNADTLTKLLAHDKDIITGLYLMRNYPHYPVIFDKVYTDGRCRFMFLQPGMKGLVKIVNTGLGCCLIKTHVFTEMADKGYTFKNNENQDLWMTLGELDKDHWCDDISFFLRAGRAGFEMWADLDIPVGHMITGNIYPKREVDGAWFTVLNSTASSEGLQFPQFVPTEELIKEKLKDLEEVTV